MAKICYNVSSNWSILNDKSLENAITCAPNLCDSEDEVENTVSLDSCVHLSNDENKGSKCTLTLNDLQADLGFKQLIVISEAKKIELYNEKEEYLLTANSEFITEIDDFIVYKANILLPNTLKSCVIKLLSLRNPNEVWLYGIRITVQPSPPPSNSSLDLNKILYRINQCDEKMSDKAKDFAKFLMANQANQTNTDFANANSASNLNVEQMMKLFKKFNLSKNKEMNIEKTSESAATESLKCHSMDSNIRQKDDINSALTAIVKRELAESENRLWSRVEKHLEGMEIRLMERINQISKSAEVCSRTLHTS